MSLRSKLWTWVSNIYPTYLRKIYKMHLGNGVRISHKARLDKTVNPIGLHIGNRTWVLAGAILLAHDYCRNLRADTYIGNDCVIGVNAIVMPGVHIGNSVIIGGGCRNQRYSRQLHCCRQSRKNYTKWNFCKGWTNHPRQCK